MCFTKFSQMQKLAFGFDNFKYFIFLAYLSSFDYTPN